MVASLVLPLLPAPPVARACIPSMKAPARLFQLSDWYGEDWDPKKPIDDDLWVSPWAKAHFKLRQQEIEIEQCEFLLQQAIDTEDFEEADGLKERVERMRSQHPIIPREERLLEALQDDNYALAAIFQKDLDEVKFNLGLPKFGIGQAVKHAYRDDLRGVVIDVDLECTKGLKWVQHAGCLERGCSVNKEPEFLDEDDVQDLLKWAAQPFYTVIVDLAGMEDEEKAGQNVWRWRWPEELIAYSVNRYDETPSPVYLAQDAIVVDTDDDTTPAHPEMDRLFGGHDATPHRGRIYRPAPRLRLWQQQRAKEMQEARRRNRGKSLGSKNPYDRMM